MKIKRKHIYEIVTTRPSMHGLPGTVVYRGNQGKVSKLMQALYFRETSSLYRGLLYEDVAVRRTPRGVPQHVIDRRRAAEEAERVRDEMLARMVEDRYQRDRQQEQQQGQQEEAS